MALNFFGSYVWGRREEKKQPGRLDSEFVRCKYTHHTQLIYISCVCVSRFSYLLGISIWWAVACQVSQLDHFIKHIFCPPSSPLFSSFFLKKKSQLLLWSESDGKVMVTERVYRRKRKINDIPKCSTTLLVDGGQNTWSGCLFLSVGVYKVNHKLWNVFYSIVEHKWQPIKLRFYSAYIQYTQSIKSSSDRWNSYISRRCLRAAWQKSCCQYKHCVFI